MPRPSFASIVVLPTLPSYFSSSPGDAVPSDLIGARIVAFGAADGGDFEGGGLVIDYAPSSGAGVERIVLAFNECGMWIEKPE
jgi:hypothetical protein